VDGKTILFIDDDPDLQLAYRVRFKANNLRTCFASDGLAGVAEARKHQPDLIVLDLGLPGSDGFTVIEILRTDPVLRVIPVIVVSARAGLATRARALKAGVRAYLQKPVDDAQLLAVIRWALGEPNGDAPSAPGDAGPPLVEAPVIAS
jgi:DNA-binding response OmpR family regulator